MERQEGGTESSPLKTGSSQGEKPQGKSSVLRRLLAREPQAWLAVGLGLAYGLLVRIMFGVGGMESVFGVMTVSFLFGVPFALGALTIWVAERELPVGWGAWLTLPWIPAFLALGSALALAWEGLICVLLWIPLFMALSSLGGLLAGLLRAALRAKKRGSWVMASVLFLPLLGSPAELRLDLPQDQRVVENFIDIQAPPEVVWANIIRVPAFRADEHRFALSHWIGFPRPVEATLSHEGLGGVREATFEGNVKFVETINAWEDQRRLRFAIKADTEAIPTTTLDTHVTVGGPFFDVLEGEYRLEPHDGFVRLRLSSIHRLSTHFNLYSSLWTDFIMWDVQRYILAILKERCEQPRA